MKDLWCDLSEGDVLQVGDRCYGDDGDWYLLDNTCWRVGKILSKYDGTCQRRVEPDQQQTTFDDSREKTLEMICNILDPQVDYRWEDMIEDGLEIREAKAWWIVLRSIGKSLGFTDTAIEMAHGLEPGRLKELGL